MVLEIELQLLAVYPVKVVLTSTHLYRRMSNDYATSDTHITYLWTYLGIKVGSTKGSSYLTVKLQSETVSEMIGGDATTHDRPQW